MLVSHGIYPFLADTISGIIGYNGRHTEALVPWVCGVNPMSVFISDRGPEIDRREINRALAKAIAYQQCGKYEKAEQWAAVLVDLLACAGILTDSARAALLTVEE